VGNSREANLTEKNRNMNEIIIAIKNSLRGDVLAFMGLISLCAVLFVFAIIK
jgi:hypothetical protein